MAISPCVIVAEKSSVWRFAGSAAMITPSSPAPPALESAAAVCSCVCERSTQQAAQELAVSAKHTFKGRLQQAVSLVQHKYSHTRKDLGNVAAAGQDVLQKAAC